MKVVKLSAEEWSLVSESSHEVVFSELRPSCLDRIDFALVVMGEQGRPFGYVTVREFDSDSVYWQYGGSFPEARKSVKVYRAYQALVAWTKNHYERVSTYIENTNVAYLKMAMSVGFRVIGVRVVQGTILCELMLEF